MPYRVIAQEALARWRDAERRKDLLTPIDPGWKAADADAERARADYQDAVEAATREHLPIPMAFDRAVEAGPTTEAEPKTDMDAVGDDGQVFGG